MNWQYEDTVIDSLHPDIFGFIYMIHLTGGRYYIGKRQVVSKSTLPALKSGLVRKDAVRIYKMRKMTYSQLMDRSPAQKRSNTKTVKTPFDIIHKENKWRSYTGSSKLVKKQDIIKKEILYYATTKKELTYLEVRTQFDYRVLEDDKFLNENILSRFFC